ncbi:hypothetical protein PANA5342_1945 [Pantoea ananatis LMG 5342]|jgi:uncharacterized Zn-binding protein involved in type VI secretion|nr:hypothetical protein PANA5342_1945 [Pantoea ananatis LMG 5342]
MFPKGLAAARAARIFNAFVFSHLPVARKGKSHQCDQCCHYDEHSHKNFPYNGIDANL